MGALNAGLPTQSRQGGGGYSRLLVTASQAVILPTDVVEVHALIQGGGSGSSAGQVGNAAANMGGSAGGLVWVRFDLTVLPYRQADVLVGAGGPAASAGATSQGGTSSISLGTTVIPASGGAVNLTFATIPGGYLSNQGFMFSSTAGYGLTSVIPPGVSLLGLGRLALTFANYEAASRSLSLGNGLAGYAGSGGCGGAGADNGNGMAGGAGPLSTYSATERSSIIAALQRIFGASFAVTSGGAGSSGSTNAPGGSGGGASLFGNGGAGGAGNPAGTATAGSAPSATAYGAGAGSGGSGSTGAGAGAAGVQGCVFLAWR